MKIGFAGSGNMAAAMARGWAAAKGEPGAPTEQLFTDAGSGRAGALAREVHGTALRDNSELAGEADLIVLAVKPPGLEQVAKEIAPAGKPVISILGATSVQQLQGAFPDSQVARTMPNLGVELRQGVICAALSADAEREFKIGTLELLALLGEVFELDDELMDAATTMMGCSPGYLALVAEILAEAGQGRGLEPEWARQMVAQSMAATGALLGRYDAAELRTAVASPGGSTEAGLEALERKGLREALEGAVEASLARMRG